MLQPPPLSIARVRRWLPLVVGVVVVVGLTAALLDRFYRDPAFLPPRDFLQYWAAGRLNAAGENPYDPDRLLALQRSANRTEAVPVLMWNPPWSLPLVTPFGLLPPRTAQFAWLLAQLMAVGAAADRLWDAYRGPRGGRLGVPLLALTFYPFMYLVQTGQSGGWLLLGAAGFLAAGASGPAALAAVAALAALKPHLFVPLWVALATHAVWSARTRRMLGWGLLGGLSAVAVATVLNPGVWADYVAALLRRGAAGAPGLANWEPPLIGFRVRAAVAPEAMWVQALPTLVAALVVPVYVWLRRRSWDWAAELPGLVLAGFIAAPYGAWEHDQIVLLVPIVAGAARLIRGGTRRQLLCGAAGYIALNLAGLSIRDSASFVWLPPLVLLWYAVVTWAVSRGTPAPGAAQET
ncbi:membrane protein : Uncharacterized protein OS=Smithella sp. SCADC GN=ER57_03545 PE=4 SV=1: DUF2029 [Gemmata massiliana]|uniref:DUF2029 domain-containing protein n=1 Tax=Gemmata massiliana TaxID=1210884 RepID=A0A6P2D5U5_9BACT|nr:glycosyltransferase 87 family protein [Gemmata massiliana]VTR96277.1 membrane protein : Uncharacterized protein OS=Smithella sp. SCADC GN=ER57_03545 PE=4 SV=1: DUF2029 [Gemmata massiliana]